MSEPDFSKFDEWKRKYLPPLQPKNIRQAIAMVILKFKGLRPEVLSQYDLRLLPGSFMASSGIPIHLLEVNHVANCALCQFYKHKCRSCILGPHTLGCTEYYEWLEWYNYRNPEPIIASMKKALRNKELINGQETTRLQESDRMFDNHKHRRPD